MIGGTDIAIATRAGHAALELGLRTLHRRWRSAVFEDGESGERREGLRDFPVGRTSEVLVYMNADSVAAWDREGAMPGLADTMAHFLLDDDRLTIVVDRPDSPEMRAVVDELRYGLLEQDRFLVPARSGRNAA
jgi:hypothetical protein